MGRHRLNVVLRWNGKDQYSCNAQAMRAFRAILNYGPRLMLLRCTLTGFLLALTACGGEPDEPVTYCDVEPIFEQSCVRCHHKDPDFGAPMSLENYADVNIHQAMIKSVVSSGFMPYTMSAIQPPVEPLSSTEKNMIIDWIDSGAPDCE